MAKFLEKVQSLSARSVNKCTVSLSSRQIPSNQRTEFDRESGTPIIAPLDTLEQVLSWLPGCDDMCVASVPLCCQKTTESEDAMANPSAQKMIICHDMMGGYIKDKFVQGVRDVEDYYFYHWQYIGAFIYFSHHFVTIPPPSWTNAAHRHGVLSMACLITEWESGARIWHNVLQDESKVMQFAQQLVEMAQYYGFDGWLINIENQIHPKLLGQLHMFLSLVTTGMHSSCPGSKVIWYDSVTTSGTLQWQNKLNEMNQPYFDLCDGIFLNYNWTESGLASSGRLARERKGEVYVGIDVFGRGCPGGGGFNSCQALEMISRSGLSSALFAPGWVFENQDKKQFFKYQNEFWSRLQPWLKVAPIYSLPLVSSFGRGCGSLLTIDGQVVYTGDWNNHSAQDLQPSYCTESSMLNDDQSPVILESAGLDLTTAYNNGASLKVEGRISDQKFTLTKPSSLRLFKTKLSLSKPLVVCYTFKGGAAKPDQAPQGYKYFLQLHMSGSPSRIFLDPFYSTPPAEKQMETILSGCGLPRSCDVPGLPGCVLGPLSPPYSTILHQIYTGNPNQGAIWKTCYFVVDCEALRDCYIKEITVGFYVAGKSTSSDTQRLSLHIGEIKIIDAYCLSSRCELSFISNVWHHDCQFSDDHQKVSLTLSWQVLNNSNDPIDHCNIYLSSTISDKTTSQDPLSPWKSDHVFLGRSYSNSFRVTDLYLMELGDKFQFEFYVQAVTASRRKPAIEDSQCIVLNFTP